MLNARPQLATPMTEMQVDCGGQPMRCLTTGEGRPLLLCHGFLSSAEEFGGRFCELAAERRLIIPDLPGSGRSPRLPRRHTVDALAQSLEQLLATLEIDEFDLAGLCLGASVASALAARCGSRVGRLMLHTPLVDPTLIRQRYRQQIRVLTLPPLWQGVVALSRNRTVSDLYKRFVIAEGDVDTETADINFDNQRCADSAAAREWLRDGMRHGDLDLLLTRSRPTLVIFAGRDQVLDVVRLQELLGTCSNVRVFIDSEQGHGWNHAAVRRQLAIMSDFLAEPAERALPNVAIA